MLDQHKRSIAKAFSWRALATFTTVLIVFAFTGDFALSLGAGAVEVVAKTLLYYGHERAWARIGWGHITDSDTQAVGVGASEESTVSGGTGAGRRAT